MIGAFLDIAAGLMCVGAGAYLLLSQTAAPNSYLQVIGHGLGAYMIGKGIFVWRSLFLQADIQQRVAARRRSSDE